MPAEYTPAARSYQNLLLRAGITEGTQPAWLAQIQPVAIFEELAEMVVPIINPSVVVAATTVVPGAGRFAVAQLLAPGTRSLKVVQVRNESVAAVPGGLMLLGITAAPATPLNIVTPSTLSWGPTPAAVVREGDLASGLISGNSFTMQPTTIYDSQPIILNPGEALQAGSAIPANAISYFFTWREIGA